MTFEEKLDQVRSAASSIESGKLPLEEAVKQYENGIRILDALEKELTEMKRRITVLRDKSGSETDLEDSPDEADE